MAKRELSIEKSFEVLDGIISKLEADDTKLVDSIELYTKGVQVLNDCKNAIDRIEKQMLILEDEAIEENR